MKMKRFIQAVLVLAILLVTASVSWGQSFQAGDIFVGIGCMGECNGKVNWYRNNGTFVKALDTGQFNTEVAGMAFDASGNLYSTVFEASNVVKFDHSGNLLGTFGSGYTNAPESIRFDIAGNAYVGQAGFEGICANCPVLKFDASGTPITSFFPAPESNGTDWIDLAADQKTLFYTSEGTHVKRFDVSGDGGQLSDFASGLLGLRAYALRILPDGEVLVADSDRVVRLNTSGGVAQTYLASSLEPNFEGPALFGLTLDPDGKSFWTADIRAGTVWKIDIATGAIDVTINTGSNDVGGLVVYQEITSANSVNLLFNPSTTPETQIATIGNPGDANAQSLALTLTSVKNAINVSVTFFYEPTDVSNNFHPGVGFADGDCENGATEATDFDCKLVADFTYPPGPTFPAGDKLVPHIIPSHNNLGVWVRVIATRVSDGKPAVAGTDYGFDVVWFYAWNTDPPLANPTPNFSYTPGWNNKNSQMYDRPGENPDVAFVANITTVSKSCTPTTCVGTADPGVGGKTRTLNDIVVAAPPNPPTGVPDVVQLLVPVSGRSPFTYLKQLPMLVSFTLENESKEKSDPTALTKPHSVSVGTLDPNGNPISVQYPAGFPTTFTYDPFFKAYYIFLSPAPYKTDGTVYTLQIDSDLFPQPISVKFVVKKF
jgi:hypothetical protein